MLGSVRWLRLAAVVAFVWTTGELAPAFGHGALHERIAQLIHDLQGKPDDTALRLELAEVYFQHDEWPETLKQLDEIERIAPGKVPTTLLRAQALTASGQMSGARALLDPFLASHPDHPIALVTRARALGELGHDAAALADYRHALAATPLPGVDLYMEIAEALAKRRLTDEAISVLQGGLAKLGSNPTLLQAAMQLELAAGRFDEALARVEAMRQNAPRPEPWMARKAAILARAGRTEETRAAWAALLTHLDALPPLERGSPEMIRLANQARQGLGQNTSSSPVAAPPAPVVAAPASPISTASSSSSQP